MKNTRTAREEGQEKGKGYIGEQMGQPSVALHLFVLFESCQWIVLFVVVTHDVMGLLQRIDDTGGGGGKTECGTIDISVTERDVRSC